jgi:hypothetical protein
MLIPSYRWGVTSTTPPVRFLSEFLTAVPALGADRLNGEAAHHFFDATLLGHFDRRAPTGFGVDDVTVGVAFGLTAYVGMLTEQVLTVGVTLTDDTLAVGDGLQNSLVDKGCLVGCCIHVENTTPYV